MQRAPARPEHPLVQRLADQRVREADAILRFREQPRLQCPLEQQHERVFVLLGHRRPEVERRLLPDDRRRRQQPARVGAEPVDARLDHLPQEGRDARPGEVAQGPCVALVTLRRCPTQRAGLVQCAEQLARIERIALARPARYVTSRASSAGERRYRWRIRPRRSASLSGCTSMSVARASRASAGSAR